MKKNAFTPLEIPLLLRNRAKSLTGFTIAELLVVASLMVIILGALVALYSTHHQFYVIASIFTELRGYTKNFKNQITKDIEEAVEVFSYTTSPNVELVLKCYSIYINPGGERELETSANDYITYRQVATVIRRLVAADATYDYRGDSDRVFIENANSMTFSFYDSSETPLIPGTDDLSNTTRIDINLNVQKTAWAGKVREATIYSSARLRNKRQ